ncbi:hypothetical protein ACERK3_02205 [Phycisphaerales bacterium AB-hyl4]|uniref:Uncharacterized protein n=1 Tax=Natronomicrosphaera hydrolytica TaxID=3242702 RepID=A0ABV4U463_9BACT
MTTTPQQVEPWLYGVQDAPAEALASAEWCEWVSMLDAVDDGDVSLTDQDVAPLLAVYVRLRRRGVVFMPGVRATLDDAAAWMMEHSQEPYTARPRPAA